MTYLSDELLMLDRHVSPQAAQHLAWAAWHISAGRYRDSLTHLYDLNEAAAMFPRDFYFSHPSRGNVPVRHFIREAVLFAEEMAAVEAS